MQKEAREHTSVPCSPSPPPRGEWGTNRKLRRGRLAHGKPPSCFQGRQCFLDASAFSVCTRERASTPVRTCSWLRMRLRPQFTNREHTSVPCSFAVQGCAAGRVYSPNSLLSRPLRRGFSSRYVPSPAVAVWTAPPLPPMRMILYKNGDFAYFTSMGVACTVLSADR